MDPPGKLAALHINVAAYEGAHTAQPSPAPSGHGSAPVSFMSCTTSNMGESSMPSTMGGTAAGDDYAFYRSWLRDQVGKDPELAAQWQQWEAQGLISPRASTPKPAVPWSQAGTTSGSSPCAAAAAAAVPAPVPLQQSHHSSSHNKRVEPDLREQIARHLAATGSLHAATPAAADALTSTAAAGERPVAATAAAASSANNPTSSSSKGSQQDSHRGRSGKRSSIDSASRSPSPRKAGPSRTQLKAVRKLFPISAPSLKPAAALQGEYQLLDILGKGAFGEAFKARHLPTGRLVCIKTLEVPAGGHNKEEALERQRREVAVLAALALHPNIIRYLECFADGGKLQLVMDWADGGDLDSLIQRHAKAKTYMSEEQLLGYFVQLVAALAHVHAIGILHRDIKTNNVFLTGQGLLKLGDFGISKIVDVPATSSSSGAGNRTTGSGSVPGTTTSSSTGVRVHPSQGVWAHSFVGTPNYLAPEMVACEGYGFKADIWAAGCVLYEMAALKPAFRAKQISIIYHLIRRGKTSPLPSVYSRELQALVARMMARDPCDRPSCAELLQEDILKPHIARYHTLLHQLKMELPRLPADLTALGSTGGAVRTAALLTGKCGSSGSVTPSTRTSVDDNSFWARLGSTRKKHSRDSAEYLPPTAKAGTQQQQQQPAQQPTAVQLQQALALAASSSLFHSSCPPALSPQLQSVRASLDMPDISAAVRAAGLLNKVSRLSISRSTGSDSSSSRTSRASCEVQQPAAAAAAATAPPGAAGQASQLLQPVRSSSSSSSNSGNGAAECGGEAVSISSGVVGDVSANLSDMDSPPDSSGVNTLAAVSVTAGDAGAAAGPAPVGTSKHRSVSLSGLADNRPAPIRIDVLTHTPHTSANSSVPADLTLLSCSTSSNTWPECPVTAGSSAWHDKEAAAVLCPEDVLSKQQQAGGQHKGRHRRRKSLMCKLQRSWAAVFGATGQDGGLSKQRSRLAGSSRQATAFSGNESSCQAMQKQEGSRLPPRQQQLNNDSGSGSSSSSSGDGGASSTIPAVRPGFTADRSWAQLLQEAGISGGAHPADAALLQQAGEVWETSRGNSPASSAATSQRSSLEVAKKLLPSSQDPAKRDLQKSSLGSVHDISLRGGRANKASAPRSSRGILDSPTGSADSKESSPAGRGSFELARPVAFRVSSLTAWWGKRGSQERPHPAGVRTSNVSPPVVAAPVVAAAAAGEDGKQQEEPARRPQQEQQQQQQQQQPPQGAIPSAAALPLPQPDASSGAHPLTQQLLQLRQFAAVVSGPAGSSLSTITEGSECSRGLASRRCSEAAMYSASRCSLEVVPEKRSVVLPASLLGPSRTAEEEERPADAACSDDCSGSQPDLTQREQLEAVEAFRKLQDLVFGPLAGGLVVV